jgi:CHAT domain-containing protein
VTQLFERYAADQTLTRAEALRQAHLAVMAQNATDANGRPLFSYAHPAFWAPFSLVGDGVRIPRHFDR